MVWRSHLTRQQRSLQEVLLEKDIAARLRHCNHLPSQLRSSATRRRNVRRRHHPGCRRDLLPGNRWILLRARKGGFYPSLSADVIFHKRIGFGFETAWRGGQGDYAGLGIPYRPIMFDFNAVYQPKLSKKAGLDLMGGIGWQTTRFYGYQPTSNCVYFGACYTSSNHFLMHVGGGIRYYIWGHVFLRPEAHYYHIVNNTADFSNNNVIRVGASIGYTIGPD